jgi:hypothetical protein
MSSSASPRDGRHYEPVLSDLAIEFPQWKIARSTGTAAYWHAVMCGAPSVAVQGEDLQDLRDAIIAAVWHMAYREYRGVK